MSDQIRSNAVDAPWIDERMQLLLCDALPRRFILVNDALAQGEMR
jgi:hypothetical protein